MSNLEGIFRGTPEEQLRRGQERTGMNSSEIIVSLQMRAIEAQKDFELITALLGEAKFGELKLEQDPDVQIEIASEIITATRFILKHIPEHLTELPEQAAFIVAVAKVLSKMDRTVH